MDLGSPPSQRVLVFSLDLCAQCYPELAEGPESKSQALRPVRDYVDEPELDQVPENVDTAMEISVTGLPLCQQALTIMSARHVQPVVKCFSYC